MSSTAPQSVSMKSPHLSLGPAFGQGLEHVLAREQTHDATIFDDGEILLGAGQQFLGGDAQRIIGR